MLAAALVAGALGWPRLYPACFPASEAELIMGAGGESRPDALVARSGGGFTADCGGGGGIVLNGRVDGGEAHAGCPGAHRVPRDFGRRAVEAVDSAEPVAVLCAHPGWARWRHASSAPLGGLDADRADVVVVGGGLAAAAAARAAAEAGASVVALEAAAVSTSSLSTGVLWFPVGRTVAQLAGAHGYAAASPPHVAAYVAGAAESFRWADARLRLAPFTGGRPTSPPDYTDGYEAAPATYQAADCAAAPPGACGALTVMLLRGGAAPVPGRVHGVARAAGGALTVLYDGSTRRAAVGAAPADPRAVVAEAVVFASGGSPSAAHPLRLARPENTGVHLRAAEQLGLPLSRPDVFWHLEFERTNGSKPAARWFAQRCLPCGNASGCGSPGCTVCADYNRRSASCYNGSGWHAAADGGGPASCPGASGRWWADFFDSIGAAETGCAGKELSAGIIDRKAGFALEPAGLASPASDRVYAAGTAGAHVLGNTYFAPGATLGWAIHSGRVAGAAAAARALRPRGRAAERLRGPAPALFVSAAAAMLAGVAAHVASRLWAAERGAWRHAARALGYCHYALMSAAVALALAGAALAEGVMRDASPFHAWGGRVGLAWMVLQAAAGWAVRWGGLRSWGAAHRASGWLLLALVAALGVTGRLAAPFYGFDRAAALAGAVLFTAAGGALALAAA